MAAPVPAPQAPLPRHIVRRTSVTAPLGGRRSSPQQQIFAASLRDPRDVNRDVYIPEPSIHRSSRSPAASDPDTTVVSSAITTAKSDYGFDGSSSRAQLRARRRAARLTSEGGSATDLHRKAPTLEDWSTESGLSSDYQGDRGGEETHGGNIRASVAQAQRMLEHTAAHEQGPMHLSNLMSSRASSVNKSVMTAASSASEAPRLAPEGRSRMREEDVLTSSRTRIFRMDGVSSRSLVQENLRLQDRVSELQDREHVRQTQMHDLAATVRPSRGMSILASTNAELTRRLEMLVKSEARAQEELRAARSEGVQSQRRFAELVEICRTEERGREEAMSRCEQLEQQLKEHEDRHVRLLRRLRAEDQKRSQLAAELAKLRGSTVNPDLQAEVRELRQQVGALRQENARLAQYAQAQANQRLRRERTLDEV